jgi:hypothetical protein
MAVARAERLRGELQEETKSLLEHCEVSRDKRRAEATTLKAWYDFGSETNVPAQHNKLRSHLARLASFCWSPDSVRFGIHLPPATRTPWLAAASLARDEFRQTWTLSGADRTVSLAFEWALVYGGHPMKVRTDPLQGFAIDAVDPWDFGVAREDQDLDDQDVMTHWYAMSYPQFLRWVRGHPREEPLTRLADDRRQTPPGAPGQSPLVVTGVTGAFPGSTVGTVVDGGFPEAVYVQEPQVREPILSFADTWQRRVYTDPDSGEPYEDWRVTTVFAADGYPLVVRRNPILPWTKAPSGLLPAENPFTLLVPAPVPNYCWGRSALLDLMALQTWREDQISDMRQVIKRQLKPSKILFGVPNGEEALRALDTPGGSWATADPSGKMDVVPANVSQEAFGMLGQLDRMFEDSSGIPPLIAQGEQPGGVRANSQLLSLAGIGAGRIRATALQLESALSRVATLAFRILQRQDDQTYQAEDGTRFLLAQLPPGTALQVSAHSASPIFAEQTQAKAEELLKAGAISPATFAELLDPPYREEIKEEARRLSQQKAQQQERLIEMELERLRRKRGRA